MNFKVAIYSSNSLIELGISVLIENHIPNTRILKIKTLESISSPKFNLSYDVYIFDVYTISELQLVIGQLSPLIAKKRVLFLINRTDIKKTLPFNNITYIYKDSSALEIVLKIKSLKKSNSTNLQNTRLKKTAKYFKNITNLSSREYECATLLIQGYSVSQISEELSLAMSTVSTYKNRIHKKTNTSNIVELINTFV